MGNLYRDALKALDWGEGAVVIGHKSPDGDSVMSALAYAKLMQSLGYKAEAKMAGKPNNETLFVAKVLGIELPENLPSVSSCSLADRNCGPARLILVDHSDYAGRRRGPRCKNPPGAGSSRYRKHFGIQTALCQVYACGFYLQYRVYKLQGT